MLLFLCVFSPRSLSWAGPLSPSEDIPRAGLRKTAGFGQETSQAQSAQYFSYLQRHSSPSSFKFCQKNKEKKNKKTPSKTRKKNHPTQTDKLKRQQRSYRDGKKKTKKEKKREKNGSYDTAASLPRQQVTAHRWDRCGRWDMYMCRAGRGSGAVTSPRPPRCSSRGLSRRTDRDPGTCAACPGQTLWRWSQNPSSLSSFSVFGLPGLLETVGVEDTSLSFSFTAFPLCSHQG